MNRWIRYGWPLIPAMMVGIVALALIGFPQPPFNDAPGYRAPDDWAWIAIIIGLFVATYLVGVVALRRRH